MPTLPTGASPRLASRIRRLLMGLAATLAALFALAGWPLLLEVEDAVQNTYLPHLLRQAAVAPAGTPPPPGVRVFIDPEELALQHDLAPPPLAPGLHEFFADDAGRGAIIPRTAMDRLRLWLVDPREREYRLWHEPGEGEGPARWVVLDMENREFSEANLGRVQSALAAVVLGVLALAWLTSAVIVRWALRPVLLLAERVRRREVAGGAEHPLSPPLAEGMADDETGYLARVLDDYHERLRDTLERERRFIADCSHELRTPVTTLNGAVALLREAENEPETRARVLGRIERAGRRMERLIQTFLMLAREKRLPPPAGELSVATIVREVVEEWRALHPRHALVVELREEHALILACHREALTVLCHNLVGNAFAHLAAGRLLITVGRREDGERALRFEDDGPGLPEFAANGSAAALAPVDATATDADHAAAASAETASPTGYGLGLSLVDRVCAAQGWLIEKRPRAGGGTRIDVVFPAARELATI